MEGTSPQRPRASSASSEPRREQILDVALKLLAERGYRDTTMLEVARRSSASKETLYAWFGNKTRFFQTLIAHNAEPFLQALHQHLDGDATVEAALTGFGRRMAAHLLGDNAVAILRAAVSEASSDPSLADCLSGLVGEPIHAAFVRYLEQCHARGLLHVEDPDEAADAFVGLLLGDALIQRLLGVLDAPCEKDIEVRATRATRRFLRLHHV